jgi:hypothetical protein
VVAAEAAVGDLIQPGAQLLDLGNETLVASADMPVARIGEVGEGDAVAFTLADGSVVNGSVRTFGTEAGRAADAPVTQSTVVLTAQLDPTDNPGAVDFADVRLDVTTATRSRVLTVPVAGIVDGSDGQAAVRVRSDTADSLVPFDAGLAAAGYVEIADAHSPKATPFCSPGTNP